MNFIPRLLILLGISLEYMNGDYTNLWTSVNAISMFSLWINTLNIFRLYRDTGYLMHIIAQVLSDMRHFFYVLLVAVFTFSSTFYVLRQDQNSYLSANTFTFMLLLGDFDTTGFNPETMGLTCFFFGLATMFLIVVMLNLLIAIISDTFSRV
jgi:Ion transport protein